MYDLTLGNRIQYFSDPNCTNSLTTEDVSQSGTDYYNQIALSQYACMPTEITYEDGSKKVLEYTFFAQCNLNTYSMNLVVDCDAPERLKKNEKSDWFEKLSQSEQQEYIGILCTTADKKWFLDLYKYLPSKCEFCCNWYIEMISYLPEY